MKETTPSPKGPLDLEQNEAGEWVYAAEEQIATIAGYEEMEPAEKVQALVSLMEDLKADNDNRFVVEELARRTKAIELYVEIQAKEEELAKLGVHVDVHA